MLASREGPERRYNVLDRKARAGSCQCNCIPARRKRKRRLGQSRRRRPRQCTRRRRSRVKCSDTLVQRSQSTHQLGELGICLLVASTWNTKDSTTSSQSISFSLTSVSSRTTLSSCALIFISSAVGAEGEGAVCVGWPDASSESKATLRLCLSCGTQQLGVDHMGVVSGALRVCSRCTPGVSGVTRHCNSAHAGATPEPFDTRPTSMES